MLEATLTARQLAGLLGLSERRIFELSKAGMLQKPYVLKPSIGAYIGFLRQEKGGLSAERQRLTKLKADILEIEKERRRGESILVADALAQWASVATAIRSKLLGLPTKLAPRLVALKSPLAVQAVLRPSVDEALSELSRLSQKDVARLANQGKGTRA